MSSEYFTKLILQARQLDEGIEKLIAMWQVPQVLIGRFGECTAETNARVDSIWNIIKDTQNGIEKSLSEMNDYTLNDSVSMEQFLQEARKDYETLLEEYNGLNSVLEEYNYHYNESDTLEQTTANSSESSYKSSTEVPDNLEVEFTPNLSWKCRLRQNESTPACSSSSTSHKFITPVMNNLASISKDNSLMYNSYTCTPGAERPQEPIYSKHFYNILRK